MKLFSLSRKTVNKTLSAALLVLLLTTVTGSAAYCDDAALAERALAVINRASAEITELDLQGVSFGETVGVLSGPLAEVFDTTIGVASQEVSPGEKATALVEALQTNCNDLLYYTALALAIDLIVDDFIINIPLIELVTNILAAATVLCFLGFL